MLVVVVMTVRIKMKTDLCILTYVKQRIIYRGDNYFAKGHP